MDGQMYVFMYACMHVVRTTVRMQMCCACRYASMYVCKLDGWMDVWMGGYMDGCRYAFTYVYKVYKHAFCSYCIYACARVCVCVFVFVCWCVCVCAGVCVCA